MSTRYSVSVILSVAFTQDNVRQVLQTLAEAVEHVWHHPYLDPYSDTAPEYPIQPEEWTRRFMEEQADPLFRTRPGYDVNRNLFSFSPIGLRPISLYLHPSEYEDYEGHLEIGFGMSGTAIDGLRTDLIRRRLLDKDRPDYDAPLEEDVVAYHKWFQQLPRDNTNLFEPNKLILLLLIQHVAQRFRVEKVQMDVGLLPDLKYFPNKPLFPVTS